MYAHKKIFFFLLSVACLGLGYLLFLRPAKTISKNPHVIIVGTSDDYPPYAFNQNGEVVGFDIDLAQAVANQLGKKMAIKTMAFDLLLLELQNGTIDMIAAGMSPTPERRLRVSFTESYLAGDPTCATIRSNEHPITHIHQLFGKKVAVNE